MEERQLTEKESIEVITSMITQTKHRLHLGDGNVFLLWGYTTVLVGVLIWALLLITKNPSVNWLWYLIWIVGGITMPKILKKQKSETKVRYYTDKLSSKTWSLVGWCAILMTFSCLGFMLFGGKDCWNTMFVFALLILGILEYVQGVIIQEKSLMYCGWSGIIAGIITMCCISAQIPLYVNWYLPFFLAAYACMTIIPGHILNAKAHKQ